VKTKERKVRLATHPQLARPLRVLEGRHHGFFGCYVNVERLRAKRKEKR